MKLLIKQARLVDPSQNCDQICDVLIKNGVITAIEPRLDNHADMHVIDATGHVLIPGLFDMHVHLREPGFEYKEDIASGTRAAARGGVTGVLAMPNTNPTVDSAHTVRDIQARIKDKALVQVALTGSITKKLSGKMLADIDDMIAQGIVAITDDGRTTMSHDLMRQAYDIIKPHDITLISHSENHDTVGRGAIHEGDVSRQLGIDGIPPEVESSIVIRDIQLAKEQGARLHIAHISAEKSIAAVRVAQRSGLPVTAEACPHHFILTDQIVLKAGTLAKVNPPVRSERHRAAVEQGLLDGTINCIVTDHAPHTLKEKSRDFYEAPFGISSVELSLSLSYTHFVHTGKMSWKRLVELMAINPRKLLGMAVPRVAIGQKANLALYNPKVKRVINAADFVSKGVNMPYQDIECQGDVVLTLYDGAVVYKGEELC